MPFLGTYPTPVRVLEPLSRSGTTLWVKHDDQTNPVYGGNKVRKVERLFDDALQKGATEVVTVGAIGSNHVLTAGIFARSFNLRVTAVLVPQPRSEHVVNNLRADLVQGIRLLPAATHVHAALRVASCIAQGAYYVPAGGSNTIGAAGFVAAAEELAGQVTAGVLPEPDLIVVALGSGGTTAGLVAGLEQLEMRTRVLAITVADPAWFVEHNARSLASRCLKATRSRQINRSRLICDRSYLGRGYGYRTERGDEAMRAAASVGLTLEQTYTAKAFAAALDRVSLRREATILYWHTLSSAPMGPLLNEAPDEAEIPERFARLIR